MKLDDEPPADAPPPANPWAHRTLFLLAPVGAAAVVVAHRTQWAHGPLLATVLLVIAVQVLLLALRRRDRGYLERAIWIAPLPNLVCAAILHPVAGALTIGAGLACVLVGLSIAQSATARAHAAPASRREAAAEFGADDTWRRDRAALGLVLPVLALALLFLPVATLDPVSWLPTSPSGGSGGAGARPPAMDESAPGEPGNDDGSGGGASEKDSPLGAEVGRDRLAGIDPWLARQVVVEAAPFRDGRPAGNLGPLYFRMLAYVDVDGAGSWYDDVPRAQRLRDADDGAADGWCDIDTRPPAAQPGVTFMIRHTTLHHGATGRAALLAPPGAYAVELPQVRSVPETLVLTDVDAGTKTRYRLQTRDPATLPYPTSRTRVSRRDPRTVAVPPTLPGAAVLVAEAGLAAGETTDDLARVRAVMAHVRKTFAYADIGEPPEGMTMLDGFVRARAGTCEQFAQASVVMLRSLGIPARVATGFLLRDWDTSLGAYTAKGRDCHAWVEVDFAGCGWVIFDPTPQAQDDGAGRPPPSGDSATALETQTEEVDSPTTLDELLDSLASPAGAMLWIWIGAVVVVLAFVGRALLRRPVAADEGAPVPARARTPWERLLVALAQRGHVRQPWQTPTEFAESVIESGGPGYVPLRDLTRRQQAARFGGRPLSPDDERDIDLLRESF